MAEQYPLTDPAYASVLKASIYLLLHEPFFGQLVSRLDLELLDEDNTWCPTAATDGMKIYFNRGFVLGCSNMELVFVLGHEVLHCLYDHLGRRQGRDPQIWNMANDYIVNYTLKQHKLGTMRAGWLYDDRFTDEMSSEEVYSILMKNSVEVEMTLDVHLEATNGNSDDGDDGDDGDGDDGDQGQSGGGGGSGDGDEEGEGSGSGSGSGEGDGDEDGDGDGGDEGKDGKGGGGQKKVKMRVTGKDGPPKLTKDELEEVRNRLRAAAIQAMQNVGAGNVPAGVMRRLGDLIEPKMDWRSLLDSHIRSAVKDDYTFQRMSRRDGLSGVILPAQDVLETVKVDVAVDTSGSMGEEMLRDIFSEVKGIMQSFPDFVLNVWTFDTQVYGFKEFTPQNIDQIDDYAAKAQGGGGTMFECNWTFMRQNEITPDRFVMFTDGYPCGTWGDPEYCDTLFVVHGNTKIKAPFGTTAYYEEPEKVHRQAA